MSPLNKYWTQKCKATFQCIYCSVANRPKGLFPKMSFRRCKGSWKLNVGPDKNPTVEEKKKERKRGKTKLKVVNSSTSMVITKMMTGRRKSV